MNFPSFHSGRGHTVYLYGRLFFIVTSNSRAGLEHFVDLEESTEWRARFLCTCEAFKYGERPCRHIAACFDAVAHWCGVPDDVSEEWIERLIFLLQMGHSFLEALESDSLRSLRREPEPKPKPAPKGRSYTLDKSKRYEAPTSAKKSPQR